LFYIFLIANIATLIMITVLYAKTVKFTPTMPDIAFLKKYIIKTFPIWIGQLFSYTYLKMATLFLYKLEGEEIVGIYNGAYVIIDGFLIFSGVFAAALFPLFSRFHSHSGKDLNVAYEKSFNFLAFLFLPLAVSIALLSDRLTLLLYGPGFENTAIIMRALSCTAFLVVFGALNTYFIITLDRQKIIPYVCGFGLLLSLILNINLIPRLSYMGAAIASVTTELVMFSTIIIIIKKYLYNISLSNIFSRTIAATLITAVFIFLFKFLNMALLVAMAVVLYLGIGYILKGFIFQEREYIKRILRIS